VLSVLAAAVCAAAPLRGDARYQALEQSSAQQQVPELVAFLQQHQRAHAAVSANEVAPSQQAQQAAAQTAPAGATEASSENVLSALEHTHGHRSLVQTGASAGAKAAGEDGDGEDFGACKTCVFVLERIKKGSNMLLPAICSELYHKYPDAYALCHQVLNALSINGNNVRYWLFEGCFKYEIYQSKEWIKPCPSHVMCSVLKDLSAEPFCPALPMENPFGAGEE